jgi:hypothetical protein
MISEAQCEEYCAECESLATARNISVQRSKALMAMAHSWTLLAGQRRRYDAIVAEEDGGP